MHLSFPCVVIVDEEWLLVLLALLRQVVLIVQVIFFISQALGACNTLVDGAEKAMSHEGLVNSTLLLTSSASSVRFFACCASDECAKLF